MKVLEQVLLNNYQRDFSLSSTPFTDIAKNNNTETVTILSTINKLIKAGFVSRVGPVFRPNTIGVSTLAAMMVPEQQLETVADLVNQYTEVNHNYERGHDYNLWFVATAPNKQHLEAALLDIEARSGIDIMRLPMVKEYHIDLGFNMQMSEKNPSIVPIKHKSSPQIVKHSTQPNDATQQQLIAEIQSGLPIVERPYAEIAKKLSIEEKEVIRRIEAMLTTGVIRRMGVVVRHRELGYRANAMLVWDIADEKVNELGLLLSKEDCITLCYQRPRHLPHWPYNLFTMIHGKSEAVVELCIKELVSKCHLSEISRATLFSNRCFKQRGACYSYPTESDKYENQPYTFHKAAIDGC